MITRLFLFIILVETEVPMYGMNISLSLLIPIVLFVNCAKDNPLQADNGNYNGISSIKVGEVETFIMGENNTLCHIVPRRLIGEGYVIDVKLYDAHPIQFESAKHEGIQLDADSWKKLKALMGLDIANNK